MIMADLHDRAAQMKAALSSARVTEAVGELQKQNPSVTPDVPAGARTRIPLSVPMRKLEVPDIPGYKLRWLRGTPQRLAQAERAGYEYVSEDEVQLNNASIGGDANKTGNTDLGSRVSVVSGSEVDAHGQAVRLYLMKQRREWYLEDLELTQRRNDSVADALASAYQSGQVGGQARGETADDVSKRYVDPRRTRIPDIFRRKSR